MNDELPKIQEQVYYGQIESRTNVLDKLLSESGLSRYNPQVGGFTGSIFCCSLFMCLFITDSKKSLPSHYCIVCRLLAEEKTNPDMCHWLHLPRVGNLCWMMLTTCILLNVSNRTFT